MIVGDFMTRGVVSAAPETSLSDAASLMLDNKVSGLPVVDAAGNVVGIVSERDLLRRREDHAGKPGPHWLQVLSESADGSDDLAEFRTRTVSEVMTPAPLTIGPSASLKEASRIIEESHVKRLPVVDGGKLVGIIARADLVRALATASNGNAGAPAPDISTVERLRELERQNWRTRARAGRPF